MIRSPRGLIAIVFVATGAITASGQPQPAAFSFEVSSVKPNPSQDFRSMRRQFVGARFSAVNLPLLFLVSDAYDIPFQSMRVVGLPNWAGDRFDIEAKASDEVLPPGLAASERRRRTHALLQSLLADRFKMVVHRESKQMSYYALVVGRSGPKLPK